MTPMEMWIFALVMAFVAFVWFNAARTSGVLEAVTEEGFEIKTLLRARRTILWNEIAQPPRMFQKFLPRIVVHTRRSTPSTFTSSYTVYLRGRTVETDLISRLQGMPGVGLSKV